MNTKEIREKKKDLKLSKRQRELVVGLLLGDGHLETQNGGRTYRLKVEHGSAQREYLEWLAKEFQEWLLSGWYEKRKKGGKLVYGFTTVSHPAFRFYGAQFYQNRKKRIPPLIKKLMSPFSLAIWFLDDGSAKSSKHRSLVIHSLGYNRKDLELVQETLHSLGIESSLHKQRNNSFRLYLPHASSLIIEQFVRPVLNEVPVLAYKMENIRPKM